MCRMFEYIPWHGIQLVRNSVDHILTGTFLQQDYAVSLCTELTSWMLYDDRCSIIVHSSKNYCCEISDLWIVKSSPQISSDSVKEAVVQRLRKQPKEFFADRLHWYEHTQNSCLNTCGDYSSCNTLNVSVLGTDFSCIHLILGCCCRSQIGGTWSSCSHYKVLCIRIHSNSCCLKRWKIILSFGN